MYYTIYKTTNLINGKYYIGKHQTKNLDDRYLGSGNLIKRAIAKYGIDKFKKEILFVFDNEQQMNDKEKELVVVSEQTYNICPGGQGGFGYINENGLSDRKKARQSTNRVLKEKYGVDNPGQLDHMKKASSERFKRLHREGVIKPLNWTGRKHTKETLLKMSNSRKGQIPWNKGIPKAQWSEYKNK